MAANMHIITSIRITHVSLILIPLEFVTYGLIDDKSSLGQVMG